MVSSYIVKTPQQEYSAIVERGVISRVREFLPPHTGKVFVVTTEDVWKHQGARLEDGLRGTDWERLLLPGGEIQKRLAPVEDLAEEMVAKGADRASVIVALGGGIVTDMAGFLAAIFMRGIPVIQIPTTLLAQVDAAVGGKTGVNLTAGKNLIGSFHQPLVVLVDPGVVGTLPEREYHAGLYEVIKHGVIASAPLFALLRDCRTEVLAQVPAVVDEMIRESVRIKAEIVSADERESGLRRILNFGHTFGHALEAETHYSQFLHGEAVAFGMLAAVYLALTTGHLSEADGAQIADVIESYGPIPSLDGIDAEALQRRLLSDKKTVRGTIHFVLPVTIGKVEVVSGIPDNLVLWAIKKAMA